MELGLQFVKGVLLCAVPLSWPLIPKIPQIKTFITPFWGKWEGRSKLCGNRILMEKEVFEWENPLVEELLQVINFIPHEIEVCFSHQMCSNFQDI